LLAGLMESLSLHRISTKAARRNKNIFFIFFLFG
jgi:hypothetical protein